MGLLQLVQARSFSIWSFLGAFSWQLWLALWLTSAVTGLVVWSLDVLNAWGAKCRSAAAASPPLPRPPVLSPEQYALERVLAGHYTYASLGRFMRVSGVGGAVAACRCMAQARCFHRTCTWPPPVPCELAESCCPCPSPHRCASGRCEAIQVASWSGASPSSC